MRHLLLFGKLPRLGRVKTRLVPPLSPRQALQLYQAFLEDQLAFLRGFAESARVAWWVDAEPRPVERARFPLDNVDIQLVWSPPWDPRTMASEDVKMMLGIWE